MVQIKDARRFLWIFLLFLRIFRGFTYILIFPAVFLLPCLFGVFYERMIFGIDIAVILCYNYNIIINYCAPAAQIPLNEC